MPELSLLILAALVVTIVHALLSEVPKMPSSVAIGIAFFCGVYIIFFGGKYVSG
jgi:hypothetical protein